MFFDRIFVRNLHIFLVWKKDHGIMSSFQRLLAFFKYRVEKCMYYLLIHFEVQLEGITGMFVKNPLK